MKINLKELKYSDGVNIEAEILDILVGEKSCSSEHEGGKSIFRLFIEKAASFLKPDGVLIGAIENRIGFKYWNGAPEDHIRHDYETLFLEKNEL